MSTYSPRRQSCFSLSSHFQPSSSLPVAVCCPKSIANSILYSPRRQSCFALSNTCRYLSRSLRRLKRSCRLSSDSKSIIPTRLQSYRLASTLIEVDNHSLQNARNVEDVYLTFTLALCAGTPSGRIWRQDGRTYPYTAFYGANVSKHTR